MISKEEIKKLAELSRIHLTESEEAALAKDLQNILSYIEKLKEVDISGVLEMTHAVEAKNIFRTDEVVVRHRVSDSKDENVDEEDLLTGQFTEEERGYLKVKGVFNAD